jgi:hypothetical protein
MATENGLYNTIGTIHNEDKSKQTTQHLKLLYLRPALHSIF